MANFVSVPDAAKLLNASYARVRLALEKLGAELSVPVPRVGQTFMVPREWLPTLGERLSNGDLRRASSRRKRPRVRLRLT